MGSGLTVDMNLKRALYTKNIEEVIKSLNNKANVNYLYPVSRGDDFVLKSFRMNNDEFIIYDDDHHLHDRHYSCTANC